MFVPFEKLPTSARVWVYQSPRKLSPADEIILNEMLRSFTERWEVHGTPLEASYAIRDNHFVILAANDTVSGCSIDSSVRVMKEAGEKIGTDFLDRSVAFSSATGIFFVPVDALRSRLADGTWTEDTVVFNPMVDTIAALETSWQTAAGKSWLKRYFERETIA